MNKKSEANATNKKYFKMKKNRNENHFEGLNEPSAGSPQ